MFISTPYELKIPADSTVSLATAGVLGETYAEIDVKGTSGPPAANGAVLKACETQVIGAKELLEHLERIAQEKQDPATGPTKTPSGHKPR